MKSFVPQLAMAPHVAALLKLATHAAFVGERQPARLPASADAITNWEGGVTYRPAVIVRPQTVDDVVRIVSDAATYPSPVRPVGKLHSPAPCSADVGGTMLDMTGMARIIEIGHDLVTAEAGALYIDVAEELARHDRQFHINTEIGNVTLGAVACAATKDSSLIGTSHWGQVSSFVSGVKVVKPDGTVASYNESEHPEEMRLLRSSYGLLGVIVEVTLRIKPTTAVYARHRVYTIDGFRAAMPELVAQGNALMMYIYPFSEKVMVEERRELPGVKPTSSGRWWLRNAFWRRLGPMFTILIARGAPSRAIEHRVRSVYDYLICRWTCMIVGGKSTTPHLQIIRHQEKPGPYKFVFSMWSFDEAQFFETLNAYCRFCRDYAERTGFRCDLPAVGYRMVQDKNALLSFAHDAPAMSIDPVSTGGPGWDEFLKAFNEFSSAHNGHPLFNQTKHLTPEQVAKAYGKRWAEFAQARSARDPGNRLLSSYFATLLTSADSA
jgi:FAD binding domain-containing protein/D-arabinono-1,4-lactone oxidase